MKLLQIYIFLFILSNFLQARTNDPIIKFDTDLNAWMIEGTSTTIPILTFHQEMIPALVTSYFIVHEILSHSYLEEIVHRLHQKGTQIVIGGDIQLNIAETYIEYQENLFSIWKRHHCELNLESIRLEFQEICEELSVYDIDDYIQNMTEDKLALGYNTSVHVMRVLSNNGYEYHLLNQTSPIIVLNNQIFKDGIMRVYDPLDQICDEINAGIGIDTLIHELTHAIHDAIYPFIEDFSRPFDSTELHYDPAYFFQYNIYDAYQKAYESLMPMFLSSGFNPYFLENMYEFFAEGVAMYFTAIDLLDVNDKIDDKEVLKNMSPVLYGCIENLFGERPNEDIVEKAKQKTIDFINRFYNGDVLTTPRY